MSKWQPIDTAPKNGDEILVAGLYADGSAEMAVVEWWVGTWAVTAKLPWGSEPAQLLPLSFIPTHWRPLPSPPGRPRTRIRSAKHGQFASKDDADASPDTHIRETVR